MASPRRLVLLGSTGSIGTQAIDVIERNRRAFDVIAIAAGGGNPALLAAQARALGVRYLGVADPCAAPAVRDGLGDASVELVVGEQAATELASLDADLVLNGITGSIGLSPTLAALRAGTTLALANKESLIAGGPLVKDSAAPGQLVPVDSEHSAIAQCLRAGRREEVAGLVLTASGGPFRGRSRAELADVTVEAALAHPTWDMGPVVTINSATLVNKALEVIEAHQLFDIGYERIEVVVHPQSYIHSMVTFADGSTIAQASPPDMRLPISLALGWPDRIPDAAGSVDWTRAQRWDFAPLDDRAFPAVALARAVGRVGGVAPAIFNAANEQAVQAFREARLAFTGIVDTIDAVLSDPGSPGGSVPRDIDDVRAAESWARDTADRLIGRAVAGAAR